MTDVDRDALEAAARLTEFDFHQRRDEHGRWVKDSLLGGVQYTKAVRVDSPLWGKNQYAHVLGVAEPYGPPEQRAQRLLVRVEDPGREHPSVQDMLGDNPDLSYDQLEFHDIVDARKVRDVDTGQPIPSAAPVLQQVAHEAKVSQALSANQRRRVDALAQAKGPVTIAPEVRASGREAARAAGERMRSLVRRP